MLTFCRRAAVRGGCLLRRDRHGRAAWSGRTAEPDQDHDYLALNAPDPPSPGPPPPPPAVPRDWPASVPAGRREALLHTSFGTVRLDDDNRPVEHGQFEPEPDAETPGRADPPEDRPDRRRPAADRQTAGPHRPEDREPTADRSEPDGPRPVPAGDGFSAGDRPRPADRLPDRLRPGTEVRPGRQAAAAQSPLAVESAGFIDEQYFPALREVPSGCDGPGAGGADGRLEGRPQGVFEEQYFAGAFEEEAAGDPSSAAAASRDLRPEPRPPQRGPARLAGRPDGVFEEQYFWGAFEDAGEREEAELYEAGLPARHGRDAGSPPVGAAPQRKLPTVAKPAAKTSPDPDRKPAASDEKGQSAAAAAAPGRRSGLDVVLELRREAERRAAPAGRGRQLRAEVPDLARLPAHAVLSLLRRGVLHSSAELAVLYKPAGLSIHSASPRQPHRLVDFLPALARQLGCERLFTVHRLDRDTTGALLLAKTPEAARRLHAQLRDGGVSKTYWALVKGVPEPARGLIDIPVAEGRVSGRARMTLPAAGGGAQPGDAARALTRYRLLSSAAGCSLLELAPTTGVRHQLRVHLGLGLGCPVLGDHKYSRWSSLGRPQRLPAPALAALGLRPPEARHLPMHLHARSVWLPGMEGRVTAPLPIFFKRNLRRLGLTRAQKPKQE